MSKHDKLDTLARDVVRQRDGGRCYVCSGQGTDVAHLFVRNKLATRWDLRNLHLLCRACHSISHSGTDVYTWRFIDREGQEAYDQLRLDSNQMVRNVKMFMEEIEKELNEKLDSVSW